MHQRWPRKGIKYQFPARSDQLPAGLCLGCLAYRIQELAYGGLKRESAKRLELLGEQLDGGKQEVRRRRLDNRPIAGTRLIREWQGTPCEVVVGVDHFDYQGRRYKSLSSIARAITGTNRNGWAFFGLGSARSSA